MSRYWSFDFTSSGVIYGEVKELSQSEESNIYNSFEGMKLGLLKALDNKIVEFSWLDAYVNLREQSPEITEKVAGLYQLRKMALNLEEKAMGKLIAKTKKRYL